MSSAITQSHLGIPLSLHLTCLAIYTVLLPTSAEAASGWENKAPANHATRPAQEKMSEDAFFAHIVVASKEIEYLANHKRYQELLNTTASLQRTLDRANTVLPSSDKQRAARFLATSRSLGQLSKAIHTFMWNGKNEQLFEATDKVEKLIAHLKSLITPQELGKAQTYQNPTKL